MVTLGKCLPQLCFPLFARNITDTILVLFCGRTYILAILFQQVATNRNMGKHVCHMVTLKQYLTQNKCLTRMLENKNIHTHFHMSKKMNIFTFCVEELL